MVKLKTLCLHQVREGHQTYFGCKLFLATSIMSLPPYKRIVTDTCNDKESQQLKPTFLKSFPPPYIWTLIAILQSQIFKETNFTTRIQIQQNKSRIGKRRSDEAQQVVESLLGLSSIIDFDCYDFLLLPFSVTIILNDGIDML